MNRRIVIALAGALLLGGTAGVAQDKQSKPSMNDRSDAEVASEFKSEAAELREKAHSHRKLARLYRTRSPGKSKASYENVARHCDQLAQYYEDAAKEADRLAAELSK